MKSVIDLIRGWVGSILIILALAVGCIASMVLFSLFVIAVVPCVVVAFVGVLIADSTNNRLGKDISGVIEKSRNEILEPSEN